MKNFLPQQTNKPYGKRHTALFSVNGKTVDDKIVYGNVLKIIESRGIPLEIALDFITDNNGVIDWIEFVDTSLEIDWNLQSTITKIEVACIDVLGKDSAATIINNIKRYIIKRF